MGEEEAVGEREGGGEVVDAAEVEAVVRVGPMEQMEVEEEESQQEQRKGAWLKRLLRCCFGG